MPHAQRLSRRRFIGYAGASFAFATGFGPSAGAAPAFARSRANMAAAVQAVMTEKNVPSIAYALIGRDGPIWSEAAGVIDKLAGTKPDGSTLYCIGSCSKVFAVAAVMRLAEQGKVDIDKPFASYVPAFRMLSPEAAEEITVRMLMNHSSGLPGCEYRGVETMRWHGDYPQAVLATNANARLKHRPGELSVYCNDGFTLLEPLVEAVSGTPFPDFVQREILAPLGMAKSRYCNQPIAEGDFAPSYDDDRRMPLNVVNAAASGGLYTNPAEWGRFLAVFLNEGRLGPAEILSPDSVRRMAENQTAREPFRPIDAEGFGLGWDSVRPGAFAALGVTAWRKNGGTSGYSSDMIVAPEAGLAVAVTAAAPGFDSGALSERLLLEALAEQGTLKAVPPQLTSSIAPVADGPAAPAWFDGVFASHTKLIRFAADGTGAVSQFVADKGSWSKLPDGYRPRQDGTLANDAKPEVSLGLLDYQGVTLLVAQGLAGYKSTVSRIPAAQKLRPRAALSPAWAARTGRKWLLVNMPEDNFLPGVGSPTMQLDALPELAGYVVFNFGVDSEAMNQVVDPAGDDMRARMCLKIPFVASRDLNDVVIEPRADGEWLHYGSYVGRPLDAVPAIGLGRHEVRIGPEGHAEWRKLAAAAGLGIAGATSWGLHATDLRPLANGTGEVTGLGDEDAGYVIVYGTPGSTVTLTLG